MSRPLLALLALALLATGCGTEPANPADGTTPTASAHTAGASYDASLTPCDLLTAEMVAAEVGVDAGAVRRTSSGRSRCYYEWEGGKAELGWVRVHESADAAHQSFEAEHREQTPEERAAAQATLNEELARRREAGELTEEQARLGEGIGGMAAAMVASERKTPVEGVGDRAIYGWNVSEHEVPYFGTIYSAQSRVYVVDRNLRFDLEAHAVEHEPRQPPPAEVLEANRAFTISLAQRILAEAR